MASQVFAFCFCLFFAFALIRQYIYESIHRALSSMGPKMGFILARLKASTAEECSFLLHALFSFESSVMGSLLVKSQWTSLSQCLAQSFCVGMGYGVWAAISSSLAWEGCVDVRASFC